MQPEGLRKVGGRLAGWSDEEGNEAGMLGIRSWWAAA